MHARLLPFASSLGPPATHPASSALSYCLRTCSPAPKLTRRAKNNKKCEIQASGAPPLLLHLPKRNLRPRAAANRVSAPAHALPQIRARLSTSLSFNSLLFCPCMSRLVSPRGILFCATRLLPANPPAEPMQGVDAGCGPATEFSPS